MNRIIIGSILLLGVTGRGIPAWSEGEAGGLQVGAAAITFTLQALNVPQRINLKKYWGNEKAQDDKVVILTFFASWCQPCKKELPHLQKVYDEYQGKGLEIMAVFGEKDKADWAKGYWAENGLKFLLLSDEYGIVTKRYEIKEYPTSFVINREGRLAKVFHGYDENIEKECDEAVASLVKPNG
jgi:peroxiredoxin